VDQVRRNCQIFGDGTFCCAKLLDANVIVELSFGSTCAPKHHEL